MDGLIKDILSHLGLPSIGISLILLFFKLNPVTSLTSSPIEMKLATKEKRAYVGILRGFFEVIMIVLVLLFLTQSYCTSKINYNFGIEISDFVFVIGASIWVFVQDSRYKTVHDIQNKKWRVFWFSFFFLSFISIFFLPAYLFGTNLSSEVFEFSTKEERLNFIALTVFYFIYIGLLYKLIKAYLKFLDHSSSRNINLKVTISGIGWFILHPIEKELFLLGDESIIFKCTQIKVIEKKELLKNKIEIIRNS